MSMNDSIAAPHPVTSRLGSFLADFADWRRRRAVYRETFNELSRLNDRDLADLQMSRADFHYLASKAAAEA